MSPYFMGGRRAFQRPKWWERVIGFVKRLFRKGK